MGQQYKSIIDASKQIIYVVDPETKEILFANETAQEKMGIKKAQLSCHHCHEFFCKDGGNKSTDCYGLQAAYSGRMVEFQDPKTKEYYRITGKFTEWNDRKALLVYMDNATEEHIRDEQERNRYKNTVRSIIQMNRHAVATIQVNITQGRILDSYSEYSNVEYLKNIQDYSVHLKECQKFIVNQKSAEEFASLFSRENLLERFENGETKVRMEHLFELSKDRRTLLSTTITMIRNPFTKDVEGVIYAHDVSGTHLERHIKKLLLEREYLGILLISIPTRQLIVYNVGGNNQSDTTGQLGDTYEYEDGIARFVEKYVVLSERDEATQNMEMSKIIRALKKESGYSFVTRIHSREGGTKYIRLNFMYLNEEKELIVCTAQDVTLELGQEEVIHIWNRKGFIHKTEDILFGAPTEDYAILYFDISHFKAVNERFGIAYGDEILRMCAKRIEESELRPLVVARLEADHFVALTKQRNLDFNELSRVCLEPMMVEDHEMDFIMNCGIFMIDDIDKPIQGMCDRAMLAKEYIEDAYVKPYAIFDTSMRVAYMAKNELANDISSALKNEEMVVYYQPIYSAKEHKLASAEALIRWIHPSRGLISPAFFVPSMEESGQITEADYFVASTVKKLLEDRYHEKRPIVPVEVNLTWMDFYDRETISKLINGAKNTDLPKGTLCLEITESTYSSLTDVKEDFLNQFREVGCKVLVDDFGSGYSSFSTIADINFDVLKLDMGFVRQIGSNSKMEVIIEILIEMAHKIGVKVIAEGVETKEQLDFLTEKDCDFVQGYYFSKPLPQEDFEELLEREEIMDWSVSNREK